jgi:glycosyltransferase involved in cell wall biosynthesis
LGIEGNVDFLGYLEDPQDVERILVKSAVGIAIYERTDEDGNLSFTYFADPGKLKLYLGCGLPILLTDVPHNAQEIVNNECGSVVDSDKDSIIEGILYLLKNEEKLKRFKENALKFSKNYDWEIIFSKVFKEL